MANPDRPAKPQHRLTVAGVERISEHLVRLTFTGADLNQFSADGVTDGYLKFVFVDPSLGLTPPYDVRALRESLPLHDAPRVRTYTVRSVDRAAGTICVDFVIHGAEGIAGPWAASAQPGDEISANGPGGKYTPRADAPFHLFVGDLAALPAIAASIEALPAQARGVALLEIHSPDEEVALTTPAGVELRWLLNPNLEDTEFLARAVAELTWTEGSQVFAHGEREAIKAVRGVLRGHNIERSDLSISAYWARGRAEDEFQAEKAQPIGKID